MPTWVCNWRFVTKTKSGATLSYLDGIKDKPYWRSIEAIIFESAAGYLDYKKQILGHLSSSVGLNHLVNFSCLLKNRGIDIIVMKFEGKPIQAAE